MLVGLALRVVCAMTLVRSTLGLAGKARSFDLVVYGGTPGGVTTAVAAARTFSNRTGRPLAVALVAPGARVGGMCSGGLGKTDTGNTNVIGGLALEVFSRNGAWYGSQAPQWDFEPHVAEAIFLDMLQEAGVEVFTGERIASTSMQRGGVLATLTTASGAEFAARVFADATYEGDLFASAGAAFAVGREASSAYNESLAGRYLYSPKNQVRVRVNPFGANASVLPLVVTGNTGPAGSGDGLVQAYNFRLCVTRNATNFLPFPAPRQYDSSAWELFRRRASVLRDEGSLRLESFLGNTRATVGDKYDMNNGGPTSTDCVGCSWEWPTADWAKRDSIWSAHQQYHLGLMHFLQTDPALPSSLRADARAWGLCADEFTDSGGWPGQLYVREGRRLVGDAVFTQGSAQETKRFPDAIGCGSYNFDTHNAQRLLCTPDTMHCEPPAAGPPLPGTNVSGWYFLNEGDVEINPGEYQIPYWVLLPKRADLTNVLVSVSVSASHIGYATLRLEPQYMIMGHAAGAAAALALEAGCAVQDVNMTTLRSTLAEQRAVLDIPERG